MPLWDKSKGDGGGAAKGVFADYLSTFAMHCRSDRVSAAVFQ